MENLLIFFLKENFTIGVSFYSCTYDFSSLSVWEIILIYYGGFEILAENLFLLKFVFCKFKGN